MNHLVPAAIVVLLGMQTANAQSAKKIATFSHAHDPVTVVAFSPDGKTLASGTGGGNLHKNELKLWDIATQKERNVAIEDADNVWTSLVFSPDGKWLAGAGMSGKNAILWDAKTGKVAKKLPHDGAVWGVAWSPDSASLASTDSRGSAIVWDVANAKAARVIKLTDDRALGVAFSPDGTHIATSDHSGQLRLWHVGTGKMKWKTNGDGSSISFSADGKLLALGLIRESAAIYDAENGKVVSRLDVIKQEVRSVAFSPRGPYLATANTFTGDVKLWNAATFNEIASLKIASGDWCFGTAFSADGRSVATTGKDSVAIWDVSALTEK
jgi:WD40 repeat protein